MDQAGLEIIYDRLATAIDRAGDNDTPLFLAKLVLLLANDAREPAGVLNAIDSALQDIAITKGD